MWVCRGRLGARYAIMMLSIVSRVSFCSVSMFILLLNRFAYFSFSRVPRADIQTLLRQVRVSHVLRVTFKIMPEVTNGLF